MTNKPTSTTALEPTEIAATQTIIRADNGDVIVADETGLRMRLSDRVIEDISTRLGKLGHSFGHMHRYGDPQNSLGDGCCSRRARAHHPGLQIACRPSHAPSGRERAVGGCDVDVGLR